MGRPHILASYATHRGARIGMRASNRNAGYTLRYDVRKAAGAEFEVCLGKPGATVRAPYVIMERSVYDAKYPVGVKRVTSLMTGKEVEIAEDTPWCCNPASETYWSM
mgnify:CR=1 FL=1